MNLPLHSMTSFFNFQRTDDKRLFVCEPLGGKVLIFPPTPFQCFIGSLPPTPNPAYLLQGQKCFTR